MEKGSVLLLWHDLVTMWSDWLSSQLMSYLRNSRPPYNRMFSSNNSNNIQTPTTCWMGLILYLRSSMCHHHLHLFHHLLHQQRGICRMWSAMQKPKKSRSAKMSSGVCSPGRLGGRLGGGPSPPDDDH